MRTIKKYLKYIGNIVTVLSIVLVIYALFKLDIDYSKLANPASILVCIAGALGVTLTVYILAYTWKNTLDYLANTKTKYSEVAHVYGKANIGKYLPGNVMHYVERNLFATKIGLSQLDLALSTLVEIAGIVLVALILSVILAHEELAIVIKEYLTLSYALILIAILIIACIAVVIVYKKSEKIQAMAKRLKDVKFIFVLIKNMIIYAVVFLILGFILVLICGVILDVKLNMSKSIMIITYYMLAWMIGTIIHLTPGGIGVREGVLVLLMKSSGIMSSASILTAALLHRMVSIIGDILGYLVALMFNKKDKGE